MPPPEPLRVGYVVKRYPRYSETFIVNELLQHQCSGAAMRVLSLRLPRGTAPAQRAPAPPSLGRPAREGWQICRN